MQAACELVAFTEKESELSTILKSMGNDAKSELTQISHADALHGKFMFAVITAILVVLFVLV